MGFRRLKQLAGTALFVAAVLAGPPEGGHYIDAVVSGFSRTVSAQQEEPGSPRANAPLTLLQINDVYSTVPVDGAGGLARVATIKQRLAAQGRTPFMVLAGDFPPPPVPSRAFKGDP